MLEFPGDYNEKNCEYFLLEINEELASELKGEGCVIKTFPAEKDVFITTATQVFKLFKQVNSNNTISIDKDNRVMLMTNIKYTIQPFALSPLVSTDFARKIISEHSDASPENLCQIMIEKIPVSAAEAKTLVSQQLQLASIQPEEILSTITLLKQHKANFTDLRPANLPNEAIESLSRQKLNFFIEKMCKEDFRFDIDRLLPIIAGLLVEKVETLSLIDVKELFERTLKYYLPFAVLEDNLTPRLVDSFICQLTSFGLIVDYNDYTMPANYNSKRVVFKKMDLGSSEDVKQRLQTIHEFKKALTQFEISAYFKCFFNENKSFQNFQQKFFSKIVVRIHSELFQSFLAANPWLPSDLFGKEVKEKKKFADFNQLFKIKILWI